MLKVRNALFGLVPLLISQLAFAATATGTLSVTANVAANCSMGVATNLLPFGTYVSGVDIDANGSLQVTCTATANYNIALDAGAGVGATIPMRVLTNPSPAGTLQYTIYTDTTRTTVWGNGTTGSTVLGTGTGAAQTVTVPGRIFATQTGTVSPGNYTDTVNITVNF